MSTIESDLGRAFVTTGTAPEWHTIERRAAGIRRRRQQSRVAVAAGVLAVVVGAVLAFRAGDPASPEVATPRRAGRGGADRHVRDLTGRPARGSRAMPQTPSRSWAAGV